MVDDPTLTWDDAERAALVALLRERPGRMSWAEIAAEVSASESARAVWSRLVPEDLFGTEPVAITAAIADVESWRTSDFRFSTFLDPEYPVQLREVHEMPPVLFSRGSLRVVDPAVSVVGSRKASDRGLRVASTLAGDLARRDITVVSGLAAGIDTAAHEAALDVGGRTVACIGTGITVSYPAENRALQERIARDGLVLSQFWPDAPPQRQNFPMRNAVMSGYGRATIIVEAGEHSGARIQARQAVEHGRSVILIDGVVQANAWAQEISLRPGVHVATSTRQVMDLVEEALNPSIPTEDLVTELIRDRGGRSHR
ncbi:DNA-processing protein DprA [Saccharopolyspora gregorii]|uniref:Smf/DprA SLOG domain-containing protein n=1 Tax=Saccharopolyspora gregorii TaxID=33914 RepID=A0ABP6RZP5_9PSEU